MYGVALSAVKYFVKDERVKVDDHQYEFQKPLEELRKSYKKLKRTEHNLAFMTTNEGVINEVVN
jgi:hypothetical protein